MEIGSELQSFNKLVTEYQGRFVRFANSYVRDQEVAEDITMDALLYYWEHRHNLAPDSNIPAYILSAIKHKCLNHLQHLRAQEQVMEKLKDIQEWELHTRIISLQACEPEELFTAEAREIIHKSIAALPEQTRRVFLMSRYDNKPHKEIAEALGITPKGVEFHITKALRLLRVSLKDYLPLLIYLFV
ncbi:RNA polymerase sigma-70 factor [Parabacteroides sp. OttesenSCG-928-O15]|nr:RNA polymerase sigma-70 factor [Parabacteroides sp. OttesenSCG-928-O15]